MSETKPYHEPLSLIIISSISIGIGAIFAGWIALDILLRRGWRSMMLVIPVYIINALYLYPITMWVYLKYDRPAKPTSKDSNEVQKEDHDVSNHNGGHEHHGHTNSGDDTQEHAHHDHKAQNQK